MTDVRISDATHLTPLDGTEKLPLAKTGSSVPYYANSSDIAATSGWVKLTSGTIGSPVTYVDFTLPTGYVSFLLSLIGIEVSAKTGLYFAVSTNGGATFFNDHTNFDTYGAILATFAVSGGGAISPFNIAGNAWDAIAPLQNTPIDAGTGTNDVDLRFYPGDSANSFRALAFSVVKGLVTGVAVSEQAQMSSWLNPNATVPPVLGRVNLIRVQPYGNGFANPPTSGDTITAGTYILWGMSL